jgi:hypothetical protein
MDAGWLSNDSSIVITLDVRDIVNACADSWKGLFYRIVRATDRSLD